MINKALLTITCVVISSIGFAEVLSTKAKAQAYCYYDQGYYVKRGCYAIATNEYGQIIQVCCR